MADRERALKVQEATTAQDAKQRALHEKLQALREEHEANEAIRRVVREEKEQNARQLEEIREREKKALAERKKKHVAAFQQGKAKVMVRDLELRAEAERWVGIVLSRP